ncbi:hypothetical protein [Nocardioides sp.]|uniref:hypothetical protein n=1 Tax=Nocardioides sp. TaxID=35761 RepID=UPI002732ED67|nr:hypothetical protein [Nocardioides sp.]MDP3893997.1 hypothetical protein [Nocardioides sp.]
MSPDSSLLLPPSTHLLHIGPHKTGSTAIQVALHEARDELGAAGVHYAGSGVRPRKAGWAIGVRGRPAGSQPPPLKHWTNLVEDVASAGDQRVCVSNEDFGRAEPEQIRRIVDDLGAGRPHVVAVARRLDKYLPSQWQERVKAGNRLTYDDWLRVVLARPEDGYSWDREQPGYNWDRVNVWYAHDTEALVRRWVDVVGPDRFTLIVSDERDRRMLPSTFEQLLGLPEETLRLYPDRSNRSLSWSEVEMVRRINVAVHQRGLPLAERTRFVARGLVRELTARPAPEGSGSGPRVPPMPHWAAEQVRETSARRVAAVREMGVRVVGDADWLVMPDDAVIGDADSPPPVSAETAAAAVDAAIGIAIERLESASGAATEDTVPAETASPRGWLTRLRGGLVSRRA